MSKEAIEAILFVSEKPVSVEQFARILEEESSVVLRWLIELSTEYQHRGVQVRQVAGGFEMSTNENVFEIISKVLPKKTIKLSPTAMSTAAIIFEKQPITRSDIAKIRNIKDPDYALNILLEQKLIKNTEDGYITTDHFLRFFGVNDDKVIKSKKEKKLNAQEEKEKKV